MAQTNSRNKRKVCNFCKEETSVSYKDLETLKKFTTERGKIVGRAKTGTCSSHQRQLTNAIKRARYLALLPFSTRSR
ncbi:MAG: 30S ribosomal protein S18 [bacterium]|nr:30S ribosomal protein S18 [bacterium]